MLWIASPVLGEANAPGGSLSPELYHQLGAMHRTVMVFLGVVPLAFNAFGQTGQWNIACSQLCGLGHYRMKGV